MADEGLEALRSRFDAVRVGLAENVDRGTGLIEVGYVGHIVAMGLYRGLLTKHDLPGTSEQAGSIRD